MSNIKEMIDIDQYITFQKLKIIAENESEFEVMFNPESLSERFGSQFVPRDKADSNYQEYNHQKSVPQDLNLKIILDNTGASNFSVEYLPVFKNNNDSIHDKVNAFISTTWDLKEQKSKKLTLKWGKWKFHCFLKNVNINYTMFNRSGDPLRAELDVSFVGRNEKNYNERVKASKKDNIKKTMGTDDKPGIETGIVIKVS